MSVTFLLIGIVIFFLVVALLQWLWNITMPELFHLPPLRYWQAFRLLLIAGILFGSPGFIRFSDTKPPIDVMEQSSVSDLSRKPI